MHPGQDGAVGPVPSGSGIPRAGLAAQALVVGRPGAPPGDGPRDGTQGLDSVTQLEKCDHKALFTCMGFVGGFLFFLLVQRKNIAGSQVYKTGNIR